MPKYQDRTGKNRGGGSIRSATSGSRGDSSISCNNSHRSDASKKPSLKSMFSRSALAKKISMLNNSSVLEDGADMSSVEVMDKYATFVSDDETSKTSNTIQKNSIKHENENSLLVISEVSETPIVYESHYAEPQYGQNYTKGNRQQKIPAVAESEGFCSADDEDSLVPQQRPPIIVNNNRKARKKYRNSSRAPQAVSVSSDDDTSFYSETFEAMNSPSATDIEQQRCKKNSSDQGNTTFTLIQSLVRDFCGGNKADAIDDNSILIYDSSSGVSFENSDDESSVSSAFGCHDLDFRDEIKAEIIDARVAFARLVEYIKIRLSLQDENQCYTNTKQPTKKRKNKKRSSRRRRT